MEMDSMLSLSCENFQETLVSDVPVFDLETEITQIRKLDPYSRLYIQAQFALKVYTDMGNDTHDVYENKLNLPGDWKLLTTACNKGNTNGYFGAAFWSSSTQQVVVSHRGTNSAEMGAIWTNFMGVICNKDSFRMISATTFVEKVKCAILEANKNKKCLRLFITGHSLGGWLAQITGFSAKYLRAEGGKLVTIRDQQSSLHAHVVAFDSPGCRNMLDKMVDTCGYMYQRTLCLEALDISNYLSAPNTINTFGYHVGSIYRIMIDISQFNVLLRYSLTYTLKTHSMENIVTALGPNKKICKIRRG